MHCVTLQYHLRVGIHSVARCPCSSVYTMKIFVHSIPAIDRYSVVLFWRFSLLHVNIAKYEALLIIRSQQNMLKKGSFTVSVSHESSSTRMIGYSISNIDHMDHMEEVKGQANNLRDVRRSQWPVILPETYLWQTNVRG